MSDVLDHDNSFAAYDSPNSEQPLQPGWARQRGPVTRPDGRVCIGRVGAPAQQEATSNQFCFWIPPEALVEKTQIVTCESHISGSWYTFYAIIDEVYRRSRKRDMGGEIDEGDGDLDYVPPYESEGYTYARASILRAEPSVFTPPRERSDVLLAGPAEAALAYGADEIDRPLAVGLIKNGGDQLVGPGSIDLDYLLGANGGHMNVNGSAGRGTKSSFLLHMNWLLLREARRQQEERPSGDTRLRIVPLDRDHLQRHLLQQTETGIVASANHILDRISAGTMRLELRERSERSAGSRGAKAFDLMAYNSATGQAPLSVALLSGSQRFRVAVSLALGIGKYACQGTQHVESVIIDEGFGSLDRQGRQEMANELHSLKSELQRIILVSHQEEFANAFVHTPQYLVELIDGTSRVTVTETRD